MPTKIDKQLEQIESRNESQANNLPELVSKADSETRQKLARKFVNFYFWILVLIIIFVPIYNYLMTLSHQSSLVISLKDTILTYSAVVGSTFGLVVAYYFQSNKNDGQK